MGVEVCLIENIDSSWGQNDNCSKTLNSQLKKTRNPHLKTRNPNLETRIPSLLRFHIFAVWNVKSAENKSGNDRENPDCEEGVAEGVVNFPFDKICAFKYF